MSAKPEIRIQDLRAEDAVHWDAMTMSRETFHKGVDRTSGDTRISEVGATPVETIEFSQYIFSAIPPEIWHEWERCNEAWGCCPFQSMPWIKASSEMFTEKVSAGLLVAHDSRHRAIAFWPYATQWFKSGGLLPVILCRTWAEDTRVAVSIVVSPALDKDSCGRVVAGFLDRIPRWHKMITGLIPDPSPLLEALTEELGRRSAAMDREVHSFAEIAGWCNFSDFLASLSGDWRRKYNRIVRKQLNPGSVSVEHLDGSLSTETLGSVKQRISEIYSGSWKANSVDRYANLARPETFNLFCRFLESSATRNELHVLFVRTNGDDAAFYVGVSFADTYCSLQTAYKEKYSALSMGFIAQMENFKYTIEKGFKINSLLANQEYKRHFTDNVSSYTSFVAFNRNKIGILASFLSWLRAKVARLWTYGS